MLRADLHVHTHYSPDCCTTVEDMVAACLQRGINCLAVTDHNTIAGALEVRRLAPFPVIVGEEIRTNDGEIVGLFLEEKIPRGLSPEETIARIRAQGGLVLVPHPFDRLRRSTLRGHVLRRILSQVDVLEVFNARVILPGHSARARSFADCHGVLASAGSDAHIPGEIGRGYVEMPEFKGREDFLASLAQGRVVGQPSSFLVHIFTSWNRWKKSRGPGQRLPR